MTIQEKIKKLLELSVNNGATEHEAQVALLKARKLMIDHKINESELNNSNENDIVKVELNYNFNISWMYGLMLVFKNNFGIFSYAIEKSNEKHIVLFGDRINVDCVKILFENCYNYIIAARDKYCNDYIELFGKIEPNIGLSFISGFINGLSDKYEEQNKSLNKKEALIILPDKKISDEFNEFTKDFKKEEFNFTMNDDDMIANIHGYKEGHKFGTTGIY